MVTFAADTNYLGPGPQSCMINFRVDDASVPPMSRTRELVDVRAFFDDAKPTP